MDNKKFENPEKVLAFLDSDDFGNGFKKWLVNLKTIFAEVDQRLEPLLMGLQQLAEAAAPIFSEFKKWDVGSEVLGKAGWLPHYTMPFDDIADYGEDIEAARLGLLNHYEGLIGEVNPADARLNRGRGFPKPDLPEHLYCGRYISADDGRARTGSLVRERHRCEVTYER